MFTQLQWEPWDTAATLLCGGQPGCLPHPLCDLGQGIALLRCPRPESRRRTTQVISEAEMRECTQSAADSVRHAEMPMNGSCSSSYDYMPVITNWLVDVVRGSAGSLYPEGPAAGR